MHSPGSMQAAGKASSRTPACKATAETNHAENFEGPTGTAKQAKLYGLAGHRTRSGYRFAPPTHNGSDGGGIKGTDPRVPNSGRLSRPLERTMHADSAGMQAGLPLEPERIAELVDAAKGGWAWGGLLW